MHDARIARKGEVKVAWRDRSVQILTRTEKIHTPSVTAKDEEPRSTPGGESGTILMRPRVPPRIRPRYLVEAPSMSTTGKKEEALILSCTVSDSGILVALLCLVAAEGHIGKLASP
jgi:hypothetical protein